VTGPGGDGDRRSPAGLRQFAPTPSGGEGVEVLRRFLRRPADRSRPGERCELCGEAIPEEHGHVADVESRGLLCTCRACYLLFTHRGAARGRYRSVPDRYRWDPTFRLTEAQWDGLQIPVDVAFFFFNTPLGRFVALYPGPGGATESELDVGAGAWRDVLDANPAFADLAPDVEALLVRRAGDRFEAYLVPIDACYELVGRVKRTWKGFAGGEEAWREIDEFFERLRERSGGPASGDGDA
jgi:hypothetical protein